MTDGERLILPTERHVERAARAGLVAETRLSLERRLLERLCPERRLATPEETRLALSEGLRAVAADHPLLGPLARARDGAGALPWLRTVEALDGALGTLAASGTPPAALARVEAAAGSSGLRAGLLLRAREALDALLEQRGLTDGRLAGHVLEEALGKDAGVVREVVATSRARAPPTR